MQWLIRSAVDHDNGTPNESSASGGGQTQWVTLFEAKSDAMSRVIRCRRNVVDGQRATYARGQAQRCKPWMAQETVSAWAQMAWRHVQREICVDDVHAQSNDHRSSGLALAIETERIRGTGPQRCPPRLGVNKRFHPFFVRPLAPPSLNIKKNRFHPSCDAVGKRCADHKRCTHPRSSNVVSTYRRLVCLRSSTDRAQNIS